MRMQAIKTFRVGETGEGVSNGQTFDVSDATAGVYEKRGMALPLEEAAGLPEQAAAAPASAGASAVPGKVRKGGRKKK